METKKLFLVSLGCSKNLVDSEVMLGQLEQSGYRVCEEAAEADLLLVNTCGFIGSAVEEAIDEILALAEFKKKDSRKILVVTGCLVQRYGAELQKELPEVDLFIGTDGFHDIVSHLKSHSSEGMGHAALIQPATPFLMDSTLARKISTPAHRAYLKITEGCANRCSYCLIPKIRGRLRSRPIPDLLAEVQSLAAIGVKELTFIAQDLLAYGQDLDNGAHLQDLLAAVLAQCDIPWLRLLYLHPARFNPELLEFMALNPRIVPYLDMPVQHVAGHILKLMNRPYDRGLIDRLLGEIRNVLPEAAIRTTLMVGFPGETEADFWEMADFLEHYRLDHVGVFKYANEEGSKAARLPDQCPDEIKEERYQHLMELQARISGEKLQKVIGQTVQVLVEGLSRESDLLLEGRTRYQAPDEIDGCVYITAGICHPGEFVDVRITETHTYDLVGEKVGSS